MMKLSTMFKKAQKELTRTTGDIYVQNDGHCALGVILHYKYGHQQCIAYTRGIGTKAYRKLKKDQQVNKFCTSLGVSPDDITAIWERNDSRHWSFARFEKKARELGL